MRALLLVLALTLSAVEGLPAYAQRVVEVPVIPAGTVVHPTLMGSMSDPASPIAVRVTFHSNELATFKNRGGFDTGRAVKYLDKLRGGEPLDRVAAGVLSRELQQKEPSPAIEALAKAAEDDQEAAHVFTGSDKTGTEDLAWSQDAIWHQGEKVKPLGSGGFGIVYPNPAAEGQVLKVTAISFDAALFAGAEPEKVYASDVETAKHLAKHGLGPRLLAESLVGKMPVAVKERIYGVSVQKLIWDRQYTPEAHQQIMAFIAEMAKKRVRVGDMNPTNLMIGRTLVDPTIRVYHIDGGEVREVKAEETEEQLRGSIYHQAALFKQRRDPHVGFIETTVSLSTMLEDGLRRSAERGFWQKFKGHLRDAFLNSNIPGK